MDNLRIVESFNNVETTEEHNGYIYSVGRALAIVILGSLCGLRSVSQISQWSFDPKVREFLRVNFSIYSVPCYWWLLSLLKIVKPESLSHHFALWVSGILPENLKDLTLCFDGKSIRSTGKMSEYDKPLHILTAYVAELGMSVNQKTVGKKKNEIPAMQELLRLIDINGCMVVADALHCQTKTAEAIVNGGGDYLLSVKGNQETLMQDIDDYVQDSELRADMDTAQTCEKNGGRIEVRTAYTTGDIDWFEDKDKWTGLVCMGAINAQFTNSAGVQTNEWRYFISSRNLSAKDLLKYARNEWRIESLHWLLDVHFDEDNSRIRDESINQNLNIARKIALNIIRNHKNTTNSKLPISKIMFGCLLDCEAIKQLNP